ncbi:MAG: NACHT domain-containing protein [Proteobacteria bacterium]|nr:NACHT domain-containing protein [Pseudomonadota bacterium]
MSDLQTSPVPVLNWFETPIRESIYAVFDFLRTSTEALDLYKKYRKAHFSSLKTSLETVKILGMSQPIPLVELYSPPFISTSIHRRLYEKEWYEFAKHPYSISALKTTPDSGSVRADQYVQSHKRVVILGSPGSGKTTFLKFLALAYTDKRLFDSSFLKTSYFPMFISLLAYSQTNANSSLLDFIVRSLKKRTDKYAEHFVRRLLDKGLCVLLLDALDEIPLKRRARAFSQINDLCSSFPNTKIIISCRTADYVAPFESFYEVELARLSSRAINKIIRAWLRDDPAKAKQLIKHLKHDQDLQALAETPLLLSLLCIQFRHDLTLPKRKTEVYKRCIEAFLREWDVSRGFRRDSAYSGLSDDRKQRLFEHVAGKYFIEKRRFTFPHPDLCNEIGSCIQRFNIAKEEAPQVLQEIERHHGILERSSADSFMFSHPSFQEYFAAQYLISKRIELDQIKKNYEDPQWATPIEFVVSTHENPSQILQFLVKQSAMTNLKNYPAMARRTKILRLLYRCINTGPAIHPQLRASIYEHLVDSQIKMSSIYVTGGVFPIAVLLPDGVKHSYVYFHKRPTLYEALQPLRLLANEILFSPSEDYAKVVLSRIDKLVPPKEEMLRLSYFSQLLCLVIPLASINPVEIKKWILTAQAKEMTYFNTFATQSLNSLKSYS